MEPIDYAKPEPTPEKPRSFRIDLNVGRNIRGLIWFFLMIATLLVGLFVLVVSMG